jgi:glycerol-3-phosphate acyltransferase PlsY
MDTPALLALLTVPAYLAGTFPTARLVARARGHDIYAEGSGNPGASNVYRTVGFVPALVAFLGDVAKGALPALVGLAIAGHAGAYALGVAAVLGHVFPVTNRFRGGRGVATAAGLLLVLYPIVVAALLPVWVLIAHGLHRASLASITVTVAIPVSVWLTGEAGLEIAATSALAVLVLARHAANIRRIVRGEELELRAGSIDGHEAA